MVDLQTVGAGGGSIVWRDAGGALRVGPESAGADPGPACYGRGGTRPTVTDANLLLGRLPARLAGGLELDRAAAERAFDGIDPAEAIEVVNAEMLRALRLVSVERGHDPRELALVAFGGAGPLHACALAEELGIETVVVPAAAGVLSALGLAIADERRDSVRSYVCPLEEAGELPARRRGGAALPRPVVRAGGAAAARSRRARSTAPTRRATATPTATGRSSSSPCAPPTSARDRRSSCRAASRSRPRARASSSSRAPRAGFPRGGWGLGMEPVARCGSRDCHATVPIL